MQHETSKKSLILKLNALSTKSECRHCDDGIPNQKSAHVKTCSSIVNRKKRISIDEKSCTRKI